LEPCAPYAWQPRCKTIEVPCAKSKRLNVLGFVNRECSFTSAVFEGRITRAVVVASIDHFIPTLQGQATLTMDNASVHKSFEFQENIEHWQQGGESLFLRKIFPGVLLRPFRPNKGSKHYYAMT